MLPYCVSKFALAGLSDGLRAELAGEGIRVTTVIPGLMRTGSHVNARFKGRHHSEFTVFALLNALPAISTDATRAAAQIVEACRAGAPQLTITWQARAAVIAQALLPGPTARLMALASRMLPAAPPGGGRKAHTGWHSQTPLAPSPLTALADHATARNNEGGA
jgi:NAD(P)-dependent dehydrogenase (short-subunit alcohol dehydrogenase family)